MYLGIDFGTTNTVAAVLADGAVTPHVLPLDEGTPTLRTLLYIEREGAILAGSQAIQAYREQNIGRMPRFGKKWVGEIDVEIGELNVKGYDVGASVTAIVDVYADVDIDAPGRLMHALKGPLATDYQGTTLFGRAYSLEELIAAFLEQAKVRIEHITDQPVKRAVFGRPVHFANAASDEADARAEARLREAAHLAGFEDIQFELEPVGAGLAFEQASQQHDGATLVFDFGGGTLDVAVLYAGKVTTSGIGIGGDTLDHTLFKHALLPWFGGDVRWGAHQSPLPAHILNALGDWQDVPTLCTPTTLNFLREAQQSASEPLRLMALEDLISKGYAYELYECVERAKVNLSARRMSVIGYDNGAVSVWQPITRVQFEGMFARERRAIAQVIEETLQRAHVRVDAVKRVVRTGGSSSIPSVVKMLADMFGADALIEQDRFTGVAAGLALRAQQLGLKAH
jgi:hypothetical chaperone protein